MVTPEKTEHFWRQGNYSNMRGLLTFYACCLFVSFVRTLPVEHNKSPKGSATSQINSQFEEELRHQDSGNVPEARVNMDNAGQISNGGISDAPADSPVKAVDKLSFEDIIADVLATLRTHPDLLQELAAEEQLSQDEGYSNFQDPPDQLLQTPKHVEKKAGQNYLNRMKEKATGYAKNGASVDDQKSRKDLMTAKKRTPEIPEETIELVSLPKEGGEHDLKRGGENVQPTNVKESSDILLNNPFVNDIPLFLPGEFEQHPILPETSNMERLLVDPENMADVTMSAKDASILKHVLHMQNQQPVVVKPSAETKGETESGDSTDDSRNVDMDKENGNEDVSDANLSEEGELKSLKAKMESVKI